MTSRIDGGERQSNREAVDRLTKRLVDEGKGYTPSRAREIAVRTARRADAGKVKHKKK